jgi:prolyl-tRNA synthetase
MAVAERYYQQLQDAGIDVLMDDRDARPGFKFKDADLIGIPLRIVIGGKGLKDGQIEIKWRTDAEATKHPVADGATIAAEMIIAKRAECAAT